MSLRYLMNSYPSDAPRLGPLRKCPQKYFGRGQEVKTGPVCRQAPVGEGMVKIWWMYFVLCV
jgi:hypothetical protein